MTVPERIDRRIHVIRGVRVMLDRDLAEIYGVETKNLNKAFKRNLERFPERFVFQLTKAEYDSLRFQSGTLKRGQHSKYLPFVFTEHGAVMLATVLNSPSAVAASIHVVDAFVRLRQALDANKTLGKKLEELGAHVSFHDKAIAVLFDEIKKLAMPPEPPEEEDEKPKRRIGFHPDKG